MPGASVEFKVDKELVETVVEQQVSLGIVKALGSEGDIIRRIVSLTLADKVSSNGKRSQYERENTFTYLEWLCREAIRTATKAAVANVVEQRQEQLRKEIEKQLINSMGDWARAFMSGMAEAMKSSWRFNVSVNLPED